MSCRLPNVRIDRTGSRSQGGGDGGSGGLSQDRSRRRTLARLRHDNRASSQGNRARRGRLDTSDNRALAVRRGETRLVVAATQRMPGGAGAVRLTRGVRSQKRDRPRA